MKNLFSSELPFTKTGTTIVGVRGKEWVILAADTRSTNGPVVANKNCKKIHRISDNIFCCGAGTAADTRFTTKMAECSLYGFKLKYERVCMVSHCVSILKRHLFSYQGYVQASLILGGVDEKGVYLHGIHPHGSVDSLPYTAQGSGSYAAIGILESKWRDGLSPEEGVELACDAIEAGIRNDLYSGSNIDVCLIMVDDRDVFKTEFRRNYKVIGKKEASEDRMVYKYPRETVRIKKEEVLDLVDIKNEMELAE